jgi:hypothetical protein
MAKHVRVKAFDEGQGHVVRTIVINGTKYTSNRANGKGWYIVSDEVAIALAKMRQDSNNPRSPKIFDVHTEEEAKEIQARELQEVFDDTVSGKAAPGKVPQVERATDLTADTSAPAGGADSEVLSKPSKRRAGRNEASAE